MYKLSSRYTRILCLVIMVTFSVSIIKAFDVSTYTSSSVLSSGKWVRVKITSDGIYKITKSDISKWGFSDLSNVRVFGYGGEPISDVLSKSTFIDDVPQVPILRTASGILFYGKSQESWKRVASSGVMYRQVQHPYSQYACYFITENANIPDLLFQKSVATPKGTTPYDSFIDRTFYEKDLYSPGMTGRFLLGEDFKYSSSQNFKFTLTDIVPNSTVYACTSFAAKVMNGNSSVSFQYNGTTLSQTSSDVISPVTAAAYEHVKCIETTKSFPLSDANLNFSINYKYSGTLFTARLDYITINYTRNLNLINNQLLFRGFTDKDFALSGASSSTHVLDITTPSIPEEMNLSLNGSVATFGTPSVNYREFIAFDENGSFPAPTFVENVSNQNLHAEEIPNMVIITPAEFKTQAQRIADLHATIDTMKVLVLTPQVIYNEFSSGTPDVNAYRKLLKMFWDRGNANSSSRTLGYLLLFGRSSYDNRQITDKVKNASYPMLLNWESLVGDNENTSYNTDDILGFLDDDSGQNMGNDVLRISIGRMPVKNATEAKEMTDKLLKYVSNSNKDTWKNNVLIIADDEDNATHMSQAESVIKNMKENGGQPYFYNRVYEDAFTATSAGAGRLYPDARKKMFDKFSEGTLWAHYIGHANPVGWTHDGLLSLTDINEKLYYTNLPLLYTATCEFTRWDSDDVSGGELMFLNTRGGVIGLITASRVVYISDNGVLGNYVARQVFKKDNQGNYQRIGDILKNGKNSYTRSNDNKLRYMLIGDPAMRLNYPTYSVSLDKIDEQEVSDENQPTIQGRSIVEISGTIYDKDGNKDTSFNGRVLPKMYDAETSVETNGYGTSGTKYVYYDSSKLLYIGQDSVKNGEFKIKFNMPSEISNNWSPALMNLYACSNKGIEANGSNENFYVYGYNESAVTDTIGPEIQYLVLNSSNFKNGTSVNESPMVLATFSDESGINVSNAGIGHQITLLLDDKTTYTDVANYYTPIIGGANGGSIAYQLSNLENGPHTLRLRVWDNNNNSSDATINFNVVTGLAPNIYDVYTNSNPASVEANFYLKHDRPDATITVTIEVFDLLGRPVWSKTETGRSDMFTSFPITWNLCDNAGRRVSRGIYVYRASITTDGVQESTKSKKLAVGAE